MNIGINIGSRVKIIDSEANSFNVSINDSLIGVSKDLANNIFIKVI